MIEALLAYTGRRLFVAFGEAREQGKIKSGLFHRPLYEYDQLQGERVHE